MTLYGYGDLQGSLCILLNLYYPRGIPGTYPDHFTEILKWNLYEDLV